MTKSKMAAIIVPGASATLGNVDGMASSFALRVEGRAGERVGMIVRRRALYHLFVASRIGRGVNKSLGARRSRTGVKRSRGVAV